MGFDFYLELFGVFGFVKPLERTTTLGTLAVLLGKVVHLVNRPQMRIVPPPVTLAARLLSLRPLGLFRGGLPAQRFSADAALLRLAAEQLSLPQSQLGFELLNLAFEFFLPLAGPLMHGSVVATLLAQVGVLVLEGARFTGDP